ncbi:uncharacterized protein LOC142559286 [Dermacentor variabilis]|uniref:uncharacterized protein LOC142559286 n=1 Tax=Dermacentor variabilis TaxID=34621 RepID=UPI003F5BF7E9
MATPPDETAAAANLFSPACEARSTQQQCETSYKLVFNEKESLMNASKSQCVLVGCLLLAWIPLATGALERMSTPISSLQRMRRTEGSAAFDSPPCKLTGEPCIDTDDCCYRRVCRYGKCAHHFRLLMTT